MTSGSSLLATSGSSPKAQIFEKLSRVASTFNSPGRLKILVLLSQGPKSVERISALSGQSFANTSQHLQRMVREGIISCTKNGVSRIYKVRSKRVLELWELFQDVAHELSPDLDFLENEISDRSFSPSKTLPNIKSELKNGRAILLDVREEEDSSATPLPKSINIPLSALKRRYKELSGKKPIYIFCRGRYCHQANDAVRFLRSKGIESYRLRDSPFRLHSVFEENGK